MLVSAPRQLVTNSPRAVQGEHEGSWRDGLMEDIKDVVGEPLHLVGGLMVSVKNDYEKPVSRPSSCFCASLRNTLTDCL